MKSDWQLGGPLLDVLSHLHCAVIQALPSDDQIIMDHVKAAYTLMESERNRSIKEEINGLDTWSCERTDEDPRGDPPIPERGDWMEEDEPPLPSEVASVGSVGDNYYLKIAVDNARLQSAGVSSPVTRGELRESLDAAERAVS